MRRIHLVAVLGAANSDLSIPRQEAVDAFCRRSQRRLRNAVLLRVPKMHARLIADFNANAKVCEPAL